MKELSLLALWSNNQKIASDIIYSSLLQEVEVEVEHKIVGYSISHSVLDTVAYKCKTKHNSENKITNYKRKCKYKKQNNNSENTMTNSKTK